MTDTYRRLNSHEIILPDNVHKLCAFLNRTFDPSYGTSYSYKQIFFWLGRAPDSFFVFVDSSRNVPSSLMDVSEMDAHPIVATLKILPLRQNPIHQLTSFNPAFIQADDLALDISSAAALWVGDLVCVSGFPLFRLLNCLSLSLNQSKSPVYCRTKNSHLARLLVKRYSFKTVCVLGDTQMLGLGLR